jgi:4-amino-4-deoxy-L-arabinose transferase-like glycosyltransferase
VSEAGQTESPLLPHRLSAAVRPRVVTLLLMLILIGSFTLKLHHLGHLALKGLDESFHAIVAANLLDDPLKPKLIAEPYLPYDYRDWQNNHIWLHKGILPLWQIALSYQVFGVETFGLRFPSALLSTAAVLLTYLIGRELLGRSAALFAAALQAFSPAILMLVHGYAFSDHIDIALLFWTELGILFVVRAMRTGSSLDATLAGVAQGLAFLSKMYPALIVLGLALVAWLLPTLRLGRREQTRLLGRHVLMLLVATLLTAGPWVLYTAIRFPAEFRQEYWLALVHLGRDVEDWAAPWDRLIFGYSMAAYYVFYPSVLVAGVVLAIQAWREKNTRLWMVLAWGLGVLVPFTLAVSKTPSATLIGWPAFLLLLGGLIARAVRGDRWMAATWFIATLLAVFFTGSIDRGGMGDPAPGVFAAIARENLWIVWHVILAITVGVVLTSILIRLRSPLLDSGILSLSLLGTLWLSGLWAHRAWRVTQINENEPAFVEISRFVRLNLLPESVLLLEERQKLERNTLMFRARRTTYPVTDTNWRDLATEIVYNDGIPFLVSHRQLPLRPIFTSPRDGRILYQLTPSDLGL